VLDRHVVKEEAVFNGVAVGGDDGDLVEIDLLRRQDLAGVTGPILD